MSQRHKPEIRKSLNKSNRRRGWDCPIKARWGYTVKPRGQTQTKQNRKGLTQVKFGGGVSDLETWVAGKEKAIKSSGLS